MSIAPQSAAKQNSDAAKPDAATAGKQQLETAQRQLAGIRGQIKRSTLFSVIVGVLFLVVLAAYFWYGSQLWAEVTQADKLADLGETYIEDNLPAIRKSLAKQVIDAAPGWAAELSKKMVAEIPGGRKRTEDFLIEQLDTMLQEADLVTEKEFRRFLTEHRVMMDKRFKELATNPKLADEALAEMVAALETEIDRDLRASAAEMFKTLKGANRNCKDMLAGGKLSDEQKLELRAWTLARRLMKEYKLEPEGLGGPSAKVSPHPKALPRNSAAKTASPKKKP